MDNDRRDVAGSFERGRDMRHQFTLMTVSVVVAPAEESKE
jgi:hypothetical protein